MSPGTTGYSAAPGDSTNPPANSDITSTPGIRDLHLLRYFPGNRDSGFLSDHLSFLGIRSQCPTEVPEPHRSRIERPTSIQLTPVESATETDAAGPLLLRARRFFSTLMDASDGFDGGVVGCGHSCPLGRCSPPLAEKSGQGCPQPRKKNATASGCLIGLRTSLSALMGGDSRRGADRDVRNPIGEGCPQPRKKNATASGCLIGLRTSLSALMGSDSRKGADRDVRNPISGVSAIQSVGGP